MRASREESFPPPRSRRSRASTICRRRRLPSSTNTSSSLILCLCLANAAIATDCDKSGKAFVVVTITIRSHWHVVAPEVCASRLRDTGAAARVRLRYYALRAHSRQMDVSDACVSYLVVLQQSTHTVFELLPSLRLTLTLAASHDMLKTKSGCHSRMGISSENGPPFLLVADPKTICPKMEA